MTSQCLQRAYAYLGLFTGDKHRFNMGFNEKGLFLARSTSGSLLRKERLALPRFFKHRLSATDWIMQHYASVDEVLAHKEVFVEPVNYLLADRTKIAVVEVMPGGQTTVRITEHGTAAHTNHFIEPESEALTKKSARAALAGSSAFGSFSPLRINPLRSRTWRP